jgi:sulfate transport system ATP-binding protein
VTTTIAKDYTALLDEPFGALDARVRRELRTWLRRLHQTICVTTVLVTQDQEEALEVADRVVVMNHGRDTRPVSELSARAVTQEPAQPHVPNAAIIRRNRVEADDELRVIVR